MTSRPTDLELATYIEDLEQGLADARAACRTDTHLLAIVRPWVAEVTDRCGPEELPWKVLSVD